MVVSDYDVKQDEALPGAGQFANTHGNGAMPAADKRPAIRTLRWLAKLRLFAVCGQPMALLLAGFCLVGFSGCKKKPAPLPPPEVQVITVVATNVSIIEEWIGALDGFVNAQIRAQVTGYLLAPRSEERRVGKEERT